MNGQSFCWPPACKCRPVIIYALDQTRTAAQMNQRDVVVANWLHTHYSAAGINTIESLAYASKRELCDIKGMSDAKVLKCKEAGVTAMGTSLGLLSSVLLQSCACCTAPLCPYTCCSCQGRPYRLHHSAPGAAAARRDHQAHHRVQGAG